MFAHGLGGRTDLPLPTWMVMYGGATVLLISFAALSLLWPRSRLEGEPRGRPAAEVGQPALRGLFTFGRAVGLALFVLVVATAAVGENSPDSNLAPTAVYITFWVGVAFVSFLVGDLWWALNPFETLAAILV